MGRGAWFAAFRAPRSGALSAAPNLPLDRKGSGRPSKRIDRGCKASGAPTRVSLSPRPRLWPGGQRVSAAAGPQPPGCARERVDWGGSVGGGRAREGNGRGLGWEGPQAGGGGGEKREPTQCWSPSLATGNFARVGRVGCVEGTANLSAGGALRDFSERQRVAFVSPASLCHLRAPARLSARLRRWLRRGLLTGARP